jgi:integrase
MAVYKNGKFYWYQFEYDGKRYRRSTKIANRRGAEDIETAFKNALAKKDVGIIEKKKIPAFKTAMNGFLEWSRQEHAAKPATYRRYVTSSVALLLHFRDVQLDKIDPGEVERYKTIRQGQRRTARGKHGRQATKGNISPATVNRELACLRAMFNHVLKGDVPLNNPIRKSGAKLLKESNEHTRVLSYDEQAKYLTVATPMLRDVATIMLETGMRPEEVYRILPKNVHLDKSSLFNPYGKTKAAKRWIHLTSTAKTVLTRRMAERKGAYLFPHASDPDQPVPKVNDAHERALRDSGVARFRLYDCRHTWATRAAEAGIDLVTLAAMLGHSKINMVMRYAHPTQEHQTKAMEKLERFVAEQQIEATARRQGIEEMAVQ